MATLAVRTDGENRTFLIEGSRGAQIADKLKPHDGAHIVIKKGHGGFSITPLDTMRCLGLRRSRSDNHRLCFNDAARGVGIIVFTDLRP